MSSQSEKVRGLRLNSQLKRGYSAFTEDRRPVVLGVLAGAVSSLPARRELAYGKRHREYRSTLRFLYEDTAVGYARTYDAGFTWGRIGEDSEAAGEYQKFYAMIVGVSQEDIRHALEVLPSRKTQVHQ